MPEIVKPNKLSKFKAFKSRLFDAFVILVMIFYTLIQLLPLALVFTVLYVITKWFFLLLSLIALVIIFFGLIIHNTREWFKMRKSDAQPTFTCIGDSEEDDKAAETAGLILGAGLLGHYIGKHRGSSSDRVEDDWLWQEKYRDHDRY